MHGNSKVGKNQCDFCSGKLMLMQLLEPLKGSASSILRNTGEQEQRWLQWQKVTIKGRK